jgi:hypothetical protein
MDLKKSVAQAKKTAMEMLALRGVTESFVVKIRPASAFEDDETLACYKCLSQFRSGPIFWVSERLPAIMRESVRVEGLHAVLVTTLLHEYGHVIYEYSIKRNDSGLFEDIESVIQGSLKWDLEEEEYFAESFALSLENPKIDDEYTDIARRFGALLR